MKEQNTQTTAKEVVLAFVSAITKEDFKTAHSLANDDMRFDGVLGSRNGADDYFASMEKLKFKFDVKKAFAEGNDVCLLYNVDMGGKTIFCCGWYTVKNGKISSLKVVFDPRPVLEGSSKN